MIKRESYINEIKKFMNKPIINSNYRYEKKWKINNIKINIRGID